MFSMYVEGSDIYNINHAQGMPVVVSSDTATLIKKGIYYGDLSNGSLISRLDLFPQLWDFTWFRNCSRCRRNCLSALSHVNYKNISVSDNTVQLWDPNASIDVGAIAKGYIADRIKDYLKKWCKTCSHRFWGEISFCSDPRPTAPNITSESRNHLARLRTDHFHQSSK